MMTPIENQSPRVDDTFDDECFDEEDKNTPLASQTEENVKSSTQRRGKRLSSNGIYNVLHVVAGLTIVALVLLVTMLFLPWNKPQQQQNHGNTSFQTVGKVNTTEHPPLSFFFTSLAPSPSPSTATLTAVDDATHAAPSALAPSPSPFTATPTAVDDATHSAAPSNINTTAKPTKNPTSVAPTTPAITAKPTKKPTTRAPTSAPTTSSSSQAKAPTTPAPTVTPLKLGCLTDRLDNENMKHNNRLFPGQYICSLLGEDNRYRFGMTLSGDLVMEDLQQQSIQTFYKNPHRKNNTKNDLEDRYDYFVSLQIDGTLVMQRLDRSSSSRDNDSNNSNSTEATNEPNTTKLWTAKPQPRYKVGLTEKCLPEHDCPYFHLHRDGNLVVNWIDGTDWEEDWQSKNIIRFYGL